MFRNHVKPAIFAVVSIAVLLTANPFLAAEPRPVAPNWQLRDVTGKQVSLADFKGKLVILDFWATWCPHAARRFLAWSICNEDTKTKAWSSSGSRLTGQGPGVVKTFMHQLGMNYPVVMGDEKIVSDYGGIEAIPTTFIIDRQGKVVTVHQGFTDNATFEAEIRPLL